MLTLFLILIFKPNVPYYDDYDVVLRTANSIMETGAIELDVLLSPINEHLLVVSRSIAAVTFILAGTSSFKLLAIVGFLHLVALSWLLLKEAQTLLPNEGPDVGRNCINWALSSMIFALSYWIGYVMVMISIAGFVVLFWAAIGYWLLIKKRSYLLSSFCFVLCILSQSNGVIVTLPAALFFALQRKYILAGIYCVFFVGSYVLYRQVAAEFGTPIENGEVSLNLPGSLGWSLSFLGSWIGFVHQRVPSSRMLIIFPLLLGAGILFILARYLMIKRHKASWVFYLGVFIALTAAGAGIARYEGDISQALALRYRVNSCVLVAVTLLLLLDCPRVFNLLKSQARMLYIAGAAALIWIMNMVWMYPILQITGPLKTTLRVPEIGGYDELLEKEYIPILVKSIELGVYRPNPEIMGMLTSEGYIADPVSSRPQ